MVRFLASARQAASSLKQHVDLAPLDFGVLAFPEYPAVGILATVNDQRHGRN